MKKNNLIFNGLFGLIVILFFVFISFCFFNKDNGITEFGNYSVLSVRGKSMHPIIKNGDLIVVYRGQKEYSEGDIVSFMVDDGSIITHEIVKKENDGDYYKYFTKGVNNNYQDNDYIEIKQIVGIYKGFRVPLLGHVVNFASTSFGYILLVVFPVSLISGFIIYEFFKEVLKKRGEV